MIEWLKNLMCILIGFSSGMVISGAVFAFIAVIGVVPRLAQKTRTTKFAKVYEEALIMGGILGTVIDFFDFKLPIGSIGTIIYSLCVGIFFGCVAVSLAEVLNVIPILTRRANVAQGMFFFVMALALGKLVGSLLYFFMPGYYSM